MTILSTGNTKNTNLSTYKCLREKEKQKIIQREHKKEIMKHLKKKRTNFSDLQMLLE
jgi:hypothetical protein